MNTPSTDLERTWLSSFLLVFGVACVILTVASFFSGALLVGLVCVALAVVFFALRSIVDQNQQIAHRLVQIEQALKTKEASNDKA